MRDILVFQLYGTLVSWGDIAVGEYRPSVDHPSKSAITGLIAAALGVNREDETANTALNSQYGIAVCTRSFGELLRDYHTIQVPSGKRQYATRRDELLMDQHNVNTILSQRDYRTDAFYQVALWYLQNEPDYSLAHLQESLNAPVFNLYLGRKSCPLSLPLQPLVCSCDHLKQAFDQYPLKNFNRLNNKSWNKDWFSEHFQKGSLATYYWEQDSLDYTELGMEQSMSYPRRDQVVSRKHWQYSNRTECYFAEAQGE